MSCTVRYRPAGSSSWREGYPPWHDLRNGEYRGSLVGLAPGTRYDIELRLSDGSAFRSLSAATWPEQVPVAGTIAIPPGISREPFTATVSGVPGAYVRYAAPPGSTAVIDVEGSADACVRIEASWVILHGMVLRGGRHHGIELGPGVHDVVIEDCDISGWGEVAADGFAVDGQGGIFSRWPDLARVVIQRNRIHHPRGNSNDWAQRRDLTGETYHPNGPQAVIFQDPDGNNVIRWNEIFSDEEHRFNDGIGGAENFSTRGFPGPDSDVYGNAVANVTDDALEIEGGGRNIRVWGNYMDLTLSGVASAACSLGPLYIFRNVMNRSRESSTLDTDLDGRGPFGKLGDEGRYAHGARYFFHNTILQPPPPPGKARPLGAYAGPHPCGDNEPMSKTVSLNNIWHTHRDDTYFCEDGHRDPDNQFDYDLFNARMKLYAGAERHGLHGVPLYQRGQGDVAGRTGRYAQTVSSPGRDAGVVIPGFNDRFSGKAPDLGAQEADDPPMRFGLGDMWDAPAPIPAAPAEHAVRQRGMVAGGLLRSAGVRLAVQDVRDVLTAPVRWSRADWLLAAGGAGIVAGTALLDDPVRDAAARHHGRAMDRYTRVTEGFGAEYSIALIGGLALAGVSLDAPALRHVAFDAALSSLIGAGILCQAIKFPVGRARPFQADSPWHFSPFRGHVSFPSGHTTQAFAVLSAVACHSDSPVIQALCVALGVSVGWARIYHDRHWTSDTVGGALLGTAVGRAVVTLNDRARAGAPQTGPRLEPWMADRTVGLAVRAALP